MKELINKNAGFTLVEVIVVSVIVAILSISAIMIYQGYAEEARQDLANNMASAAAKYLMTAINLDQKISDENNFPSNLNGSGKWSFPMLSGGQATFKCPSDVTLKINKQLKSVKAIYKSVPSKDYYYDR